VPIGQYFGAWLLACCLLQAMFAWLLLSRAGVDRQARVMGSVVLLFAPFFLYRVYEHFALAAQWLLLAALYLATVPESVRRRGLAWTCLVGATAMVHGTLLVIVGAVWAADGLRRLVETRRAALLAEATAVPITAFAALSMAGFFAVRHGRANDMVYGAWGMDLAGAFLGYQFSQLMPTPPGPMHHEAPTVYLGTGGVLLVIAALGALARAPAMLRPLARFWPLIAAMAVLLVLAVTHRVGLLGREIIVLPLPVWAIEMLAPLRSSNRFAWPALYGVLVLAVIVVARRFPPAVSARVLLVAAALQLGDTARGWVPYRIEIAAAPSNWVSPLSDPFWAEAGARYSRLRQLLPTGQPEFQSDEYPEGWALLSDYAHRNGWDTDVAYLARVSAAAWEARRADARARIAERRWEVGTLYVVQPAMRESVRIASDPRRDFFGEVNGFTVFAPGWYDGRPALAPAVAPGP